MIIYLGGTAQILYPNGNECVNPENGLQFPKIDLLQSDTNSPNKKYPGAILFDDKTLFAFGGRGELIVMF